MSAGKDEAVAAADIGHRRQMRTRREKKWRRGGAERGEADRLSGAKWRREIDEGGSAGRQRWQHLLVSLR